MKRPTLDDVYTLDSGHHVIEEEMSCAACGDPFEVGERAVEVPLNPSDPTSRLIVTEHLHCAVKNDEVELQPRQEWHVFDKDDPSTWPSEQGGYWVAVDIGDEVVVRHDLFIQNLFPVAYVTHWMEISVPEAPQ